MLTRPLFSSLSVIALVLGVGCLVPVAEAAPLPGTVQALRNLAEDYEKRQMWPEAARLYDEALKRDRHQPELRDAYQRCVRHIHQARRHRDDSFKVLLSLKAAQAADVYEEVLTKLRNNYIDRGSVDAGRLFQQGLDEFSWALEDDVFLREHLASAGRDAVSAFRARLDEWRNSRPATTREARDLALDIALRAKRGIALEPVVVLLEFACGACNGLDEYTAYLTPGQMTDILALSKGELVGIGVQTAVVDQKLLIAQVAPESDAFEKRLRPGDRVLQIDRQPVDEMTAEAALGRLQGESGSKVELLVVPLGEITPRTVKVVRRPVLVRSVDFELLMEDTTRIGLLRVLTFHENTLQEVRDAVVQLQSLGIAVLILDLRGNGGGSFRPAVQMAELFLHDAVIVMTHSRLRGYNRTFKADNPHALDIPLVVLVDGETASAAEVVAGALKENQRATLVGQTTFGKGSIQAVLALDKVPAGVRITVAKFYSPADYAYSGRGVTPHEVVDAGAEAQLSAARAAALRLAMMMGR